jgi:hypothetical protein
VKSRDPYAFRENENIDQPLALETRDDSWAEECTTDHLKYRKKEPAEQAAWVPRLKKTRSSAAGT